MTRPGRALLLGGLMIVLMPAVAGAQSSTPATQTPLQPPSKLWVVAGVASATVKADCQTCEEESPYRHSVGLLGDVGYRVTARMDVGGEVFWMSTNTASGQARVTHFDAVAQFRPWASHGFFLKGGAGMAFLRNWVDAVGASPSNQKALSVVIGAGWVFRPNERVGFQIFGSQHAGAIGDVKTSTSDVSDVMANFWSVGAAIVIR
jgi:hypothetical protein